MKKREGPVVINLNKKRIERDLDPIPEETGSKTIDEFAEHIVAMGEPIKNIWGIKPAQPPTSPLHISDEHIATMLVQEVTKRTTDDLRRGSLEPHYLYILAKEYLYRKTRAKEQKERIKNKDENDSGGYSGA